MTDHKSPKNVDQDPASRRTEDGTMTNPKFSFESDADFLYRARIEEHLGALADILDWEPAVRAVGIRIVSRHLGRAVVGLKKVAAIEQTDLTPRQKQLAAEILANDISRRPRITVKDVEDIGTFAATVVP